MKRTISPMLVLALCTVAKGDFTFGEPTNLGPTVNSSDYDWSPSITADGLSLIFTSDRDGGSGRTDLWMTRRSTIDGPWSEPVNLGPTINGDKRECEPVLSANGRSLLFCSNRAGGHGDYDIWQASIDPVVDFNGDGMIDLVDLVMLIDNWGTADTLHDIGPMPWGDGVVDVEDLKVFMAYWEKENQLVQP